MAPGDRKRRVVEYVRERMRAECAEAARGRQAAIARATGTSTPHIANMLKDPPTRNPGEDFRHKIAAYWGISYVELERLALGEPVTPEAEKPLTREDLRQVIEELKRRDARDEDEATPPPAPVESPSTSDSGPDGPKKSGSSNG